MKPEIIFEAICAIVICGLLFAMLMCLARPLYFEFDSLKGRLIAQGCVIALAALSVGGGYEFSVAVDSGIQHFWQIPLALVGLLWLISFCLLIGVYAALFLGAYALGGLGWVVVDLYLVSRGKASGCGLRSLDL